MTAVKAVHTTGSIKPFLESACGDGRLTAVSTAAFRVLRRECITTEAAFSWLAELVEQKQAPIYIHLPQTSIALAPKAWTRERLVGWLAVHAPELEDEFRIDFTHIYQGATR